MAAGGVIVGGSYEFHTWGEHESPVFSFQTADLPRAAALVRDAVETWAPPAAAKRVTLEGAPTVGDTSLTADAPRVLQAGAVACALQTPMLYFYLERELILDFFEAAAGSRMMCNYMRFGGVAYDLPDYVREQETISFLEELIYEHIPARFGSG